MDYFIQAHEEQKVASSTPQTPFHKSWLDLFQKMDTRSKEIRELFNKFSEFPFRKVKIQTKRGYISLGDVQPDDDILYTDPDSPDSTAITISPARYLDIVRERLEGMEKHPFDASPNLTPMIDPTENRRYITNSGRSAFLVAHSKNLKGDEWFVLRLEEEGTIEPTGIGDFQTYNINGKPDRYFGSSSTDPYAIDRYYIIDKS